MTEEAPYRTAGQPYAPLPYNEVITLHDGRLISVQNVICLHDGRLMSVHSADACASETCPIHRPSDHRLSSAPLFWHPDKRMMLRRCDHKALHPDPDDLKIQTWPEEGAHDCDGCCEVTG